MFRDNEPGEALELTLAHDILGGETTLSWAAPADPGGSSLVYDTLRSDPPDGFGFAGECVESDDGDNEAVEIATPAIGEVRFYLVRAQNDCPGGQGSLGSDSESVERPGIACPPVGGGE